MDVVRRTRDYVRESFEEHPQHSFDDWKIMYRHAVKMHDISIAIAGHFASVDRVVIAVGALLYEVHKYDKSKGFISGLGLTNGQRSTLDEVLTGRGLSIEGRVVQDADTVAFYLDEKMQETYHDWVLQRREKKKLKEKLGEYDNLHFNVSKELAKSHYEKLRRKWS